MNMLFNNKDITKRRICDRKILKSMIIPVDNHEINKKITVTVQPRNACKMEFVNYL